MRLFAASLTFCTALDITGGGLMVEFSAKNLALLLASSFFMAAIRLSMNLSGLNSLLPVLRKSSMPQSLSFTKAFQLVSNVPDSVVTTCLGWVSNEIGFGRTLESLCVLKVNYMYHLQNEE